MVTAIIMLQRVLGANLLLRFCLLCLLAAAVAAFLIKGNRGKRNGWIAALGILLPAILCDGVWYCVYFPGGQYRNTGMASIFWVLLYPLLLTAGVAAASAINKRRSQK